MDRQGKVEAVESLNGIFSNAGVIVVTHYSGLTMSDLTTLRVGMAEVSAQFKVIKNRLAKRALAGTEFEPLEDLFRGPTAIAFSEDPISAPKAVTKFAKDHEQLVILGGIMGGNVLDEKGVQALAALPSLDELRGQIVGMLNTPATRIAGILQQPGGQVARVLSAYGQKDAA